MDASETGWPDETPGSSGDELALRFPRHHAFVVGIDTYAHGISPLRTAAADARRLAEVLARQHRFTVHPPLLDGAASRAQLLRLLDTTMPAQVGADDRVLLYFAGHGVAADGDDGPAGYLVPSDARPRDTDSLLPMSALQAALDALPCRHLLVILDCCFSGAFRWGSAHRDTFMVPKKLYRERFDRFIADPARQVITSSAHDQKALDVLASRPTGDRGQVECDGQAHSPFAAALFRALDGHADMWATDRHEGDGVITATELYAYLRDEIEPATLAADERLRQTPSFFALRGHDKGEFVFLHPHHRLNLPAMDPTDSPYKGLRSFEMNDAHLFYGRERVVRELRRRFDLADERLLVVTGASGTGKSSVVKAGLMPQLKDAGWNLLEVLRPGDHPDTALAGALLKASAKSVLVIDQMEEAVTRCADPEARARFEAGLARLLDGDGPVSKVIVTVRSDFEPQFFGGPLGARWKTARFTVPPFSAAELRQVVEMPALQASMIFEPPSLVDRMVEEVVQAAGALPLLSYALSELFVAYQQRGGADRAITQGDYERLGGVTGALTQKADALWAALDASGQDDLRRIMLRMVSLGSALAGRRVPRREIAVSAQDEAPVNRVIDELDRARLVVATQDAGVDCIEPAHDALIRAWPRLLQWIDAFPREKLSRAGRLAAAAAEHAQRTEREAHGLLWHDNPDLPAVERDLRDGPPWFNPREQAFIRASVARRERRRRTQAGIAVAVIVGLAGLAGIALWERDRAVEERITARAGELAAQAEAILPQDPDLAALLAIESWRLRELPRARGVILSVPALAPYRFALRPPPPSDPNAPWAGLASASLSADGTTVIGIHFPPRLTLWDARSGALRHLKPLPNAAPPPETSNVQPAVAPDGSLLLTADGSNVRLWEASTGRQRLHLTAPNGPVEQVGFSKDGRWIHAVGGGSLQIWEASSGLPQRQLGSPQSPIIAVVTWTSDNVHLVTQGSDKHLSVHPLVHGEARRLTATPLAYPVEPSPDGHWLVVDGPDHGDSAGLAPRTDASVLDPRTGRIAAKLHLEGVLPDLGQEVKRIRALSPSGNALVQIVSGASSAGSLYALPQQGRGPAARTRLGDDLTYAKFSPDGGQLVTADRRGEVQLRHPLTGAVLQRIQAHDGPVVKVVYAPDGTRFLTAGWDGHVHLWRRGDGQRLHSLLAHTGPVLGASFSRDGRTVVTLGEGGAARLWDTAAGEGSAFTLNGPRKLDSARPALSPNGRWLAVVSGGRIWGYDLPMLPRETTTEPESLTARLEIPPAYDDEVNWIEASPDGMALAVTRRSRVAQVLAWPDGGLLKEHVVPGVDFGSFFSPDSRELLSMKLDGGNPHLWWRAITAERGNAGKGASTSAAGSSVPAGELMGWSDDGQTFLTSTGPGQIQHWSKDLTWTLPALEAEADSAGRVLLSRQFGRNRVFRAGHGRDALTLMDGYAILSPDGSTAAVVHGTNGTLWLFDTTDGRLRRTIEPASKGAQVLPKFSPDGRLLLVSEDLQVLRVIDAESGATVRQLRGRESPGGRIRRDAFTADGSSIVVLTDDRIVRRWACGECRPIEEQIAAIKARIGRELTPEERRDHGLPPARNP